ncbi:MAG: hypothetical protein KGK07_02360 [Chloroflexota bacterium]|nr:hypothetical protein [Chloroflexota bacterium]
MRVRSLTLAGLFGALVVVSAACGGGGGATPSPNPGAATQTDNGAGAVTVTATWVTPDHLADDDKLRAAAAAYLGPDVALVHVALNTHSVDLSKYDLGKLSTLDAGQGAQPPLGWKRLSSSDSHHTEAVLAFKRPASTRDVTLTIREVGGVAERRLAWAPAPS